MTTQDSVLPEPLSRWGVKEWAIAMAVLAAVVFLPSITNGFAYDDLPIILRDNTTHSLGGISELLTRPYWPGDEGIEFGLWRPVTSVSLTLLWSLAGGATWAFHLANILLHAGVTAAVVVLGSRFFGLKIGALGGFFFALHPVHVEAVANSVGIAELLSALFILLALERSSRPGERESDPGGGAGSRLRVARDVAFLYLLAFLSKEGAVVLPGLVFLLDAGTRRLTLRSLPTYLRDRGAMYGGMLAVAIAVLWGRSVILGGVADPMPGLGAGLLTEIPRIFTGAEIWAHQLRLLAWPFHLSPDYSPSVVRIVTVFTATGLLALLAVLSILVGSALWYRKRTGRSDLAVPAGVMWFVICVSPVANLVFVSGVLVAERILYLPSVGAAFAMAGLAAAVPTRLARPGLIALLVLGAAWTARSVTYQPAWKDHATIFEHMLHAVPESGRSAWVRGDLAVENGRVEEALTEYRTALGKLGGEYVFLTESARRLISNGRSEVAVPFLERAWNERPDRSVAPQLMTVVSSRAERWEDVAIWARRTIEADPTDLPSRHLLSGSLAAQGRWAEAAREREALLEIAERGAWQQWYWLTELRGRAGEPEGARAAADSARRLAPGPAQIRQIDSVLTVVLGGG